MSSGICPNAYLKAAYGAAVNSHEGQELILTEIIALLDGWITVWIPWAMDCRTLADRLMATKEHIILSDRGAGDDVDAIYFGTPTVNHGMRVFPGIPPWDAKQDRAWVRSITEECEALAYTNRHPLLMVSGLGEGDVTPAQRSRDMGGAELVCQKRFTEYGICFWDYIFVREIRP